MILKSLKVSNILSFGYIQDFDLAPNTIEFKEDLNILIGSNGSGKSNLLEIINKLFQGHFFEYYYIHDGALYSNQPTEKLIRINQDRKNNVQNTLLKHFNFKNQSSYLQVEIFPDKGDIENLLNLHKRLPELKSYSEKYCQHQRFLDAFEGVISEEIKNISVAKYKFQVGSTPSTNRIEFSLQSGVEAKSQNLFYNYLLFFNQLQTLLEIINLYEGQSWPLMKSPFALISSMRQYGGFTNSFSVGVNLNEQVKSTDQNESNSSTKNYAPTDYIFRITAIRLGQLFRRLMHHSGVKEALKEIEKPNHILSKINVVLKKNLGFVLKLENYNEGNDTIMLQIYKDSESINFLDLSMGQKSIFYLLFAVYGYDIRNGLLIIDEPELHLHVTMQKKYFSILKEVCKKANIQIIIATHSSVFIDENTIKNTYRFFKNNNLTSIVRPASITQSQKDLIKILTYTNSSRIFFSDNVVLVEGNSDEYFFTYFYENYIKINLKADKEIEILYIGGKGNFSKWREFLKLFEINSYFIGDFDNVKEFHLMHKAGIDFKSLIEKSKEEIVTKVNRSGIAGKQTKDGAALLKELDKIIENKFVLEDEDKDNLTSLWLYLIEKQGVNRNHIIEYLNNEDNLILFKKLKEEIDKLYDDGIFILKNGDLENYLSISKDLANVISFCQNDFEGWIRKEESSKVLELKNIFQNILN